MKKDKVKKLKKQKYKVKKNGNLKNKNFDLIETDAGLVPRDTTFPVGEEQLFQATDVEAV